MRANRSSGTRPELALAAALRAAGLRPKANVRGLPGSPDFAFPRAKLAVFLHGCFWHACPRHGSRPKSNVAFWSEKLDRNRRRDRRVARALRASGWSVVTLWEHDVKRDAAACAARVKKRLLLRNS